MGQITLDMNMPWPQKNAKLFIHDGTPEHFSRIGWGDASQQYVLYMTGYKNAADTLIDHVLALKNVERLDTFIFPILFLYRQFIELELKWVFLVHSPADIPAKKAFIQEMKHDLCKLWSRIKPILLEEATPEERQDVDTVEDYVMQFDRLDKSSSSFRYPITMKLDQVLNDEQQINLPNLRQRMNELYHFFSGVDGKLSSIRDCKRDMEKYFDDAGDNFGWRNM